MFGPRIVGGLLITLASATIAHAQVGLGTPQACDEHRAFPNLNGLARSIAGSPRVVSPPIAELAPPTPTRDEVAHMMADGTYSPVEIFAAKIKLDEANVKSRIAAVRYLATLDIHFYPEAETGLISALRADRNENVRYEAALGLGTDRHATRRIVDALSVSALGHVTDGHPSETAERVRAAARQSLTRVLAKGAPNDYLPPVTVLPLTSPRLQVDGAVDPRLRDLSMIGAGSSLAIPRR